MKKIMLLLTLICSIVLVQAQQPKPGKPMAQRPKGDPMQNIDKRIAQMTKQYNLNEAQQKQVRELMVSSGEKMKAVREKHKGDRKAAAPEMKVIRQEYHTKLKTILTPEQYAKWKVDAKARHEKMKMKRESKMQDKAPAPSPVKADEDEDDLNVVED
ncbi:MAG TPA: hypothetical protein VK202_04990 [Bacteroidia bacterium]|nr:hypothetical protein [Bacteroidia bacterium]